MKHSWALGIAVSLGVGCVTEVDLALDLDRDGLLLEEEWGTDPHNPDSDEDGHLDGAEVDAGADPLDIDDHPYRGGWSLDACRKSIESSGDQEGEIAHNFHISDQYEDTLKLHDFCGKVVLIEVSGFG